MRLPPATVLASWFALAATLCGCGPGSPTLRSRRGDVTARSFEFHGGAEGEWNVRFRGDSFWVAFEMDGKIQDFGSVKLEEREADRLWFLIDSAQFERRKSSERKAGDDEEQLYFFWVAPREAGLRDVPVDQVEIWADDVYNDKKLTKLIRYVGKLILKYHKKKPVL